MSGTYFISSYVVKYGNGHGSNIEVYFNGTLLEIIEVSKV